MATMQRPARTTRFFATLVLMTGLAGLSYWYYNARFGEGIYEYNPSLDRSFIINLFKKDWYWLISDYSAKDYSVEHMLDDKASSKDTHNDLTIKAYRVKGNPVGFVAYYPKEFFEGYILFLAVDKTQRSKGYARKMLAYAINDLKKRGATVIRLITRTDNVAGQKLYRSVGFNQIWTDGAYVKFEKVLAA